MVLVEGGQRAGFPFGRGEAAVQRQQGGLVEGAADGRVARYPPISSATAGSTNSAKTAGVAWTTSRRWGPRRQCRST